MQRKAKEQEERTMEQERINEGLKELNREEKENFARYDFVFFIIVYCLQKGKIFHVERGQCAITRAVLTFFLCITFVLKAPVSQYKIPYENKHQTSR